MFFCIENEINLNNKHCNSDTYVKMNNKLSDINDEHFTYMKLNRIDINDETMQLPN